jgi:hypothetical protein
MDRIGDTQKVRESDCCAASIVEGEEGGGERKVNRGGDK